MMYPPFCLGINHTPAFIIQYFLDPNVPLKSLLCGPLEIKHKRGCLNRNA